MLCFHFHSVVWTFKFFFEISSFTHGLLRSMFNFPSVCRFFCCLSVIDFLFDTIMVRKHTLYDLIYFKFINLFYNLEDSQFWWMFHVCMTEIWDLLLLSRDLCCFIIFFYFSLCYLHWVNSICLSSSSRMLSFVISILWLSVFHELNFFQLLYF